jgi:hypothetical protein
MTQGKSYTIGGVSGRVGSMLRWPAFVRGFGTAPSNSGATADWVSPEVGSSSLAKATGQSWIVSRGQLFLVAALCLLATGSALRFYHLGDRSLWFDEALTANTSRGTLAQMMEVTRARCSAPVVHPYILYLAQKAGEGPMAARIPSVIASLLAILVILAMVRAKVSYSAAVFAASILTVSASQIRYAQEVREYSLSVLCAAVLIYCLLRWQAGASHGRHPLLLYAVLFLAPLIQYGLLFFAGGVLATIALRLLLRKEVYFTFRHLLFGSMSLAVGGLLSFLLTLRYQFRPGQTPWYLASYYFDPRRGTLLHFVSTNTGGLVRFLIPLRMVLMCFVLATFAFIVKRIRARQIDSVSLLLLTTLTIFICASLLRVYPYGGIRQCLFLAPVLALFAGVVFAEVLKPLRGYLRPAVTVALIALILVSGYRSLLNEWPYAEYEDTRSILKELARSSTANDQIWVNHDAAEAFKFYLRGNDPRFTYGRFHPVPQDYIPELFGSIHRDTNRLWLAFSHLQQPSDHAEEQLIVNSLRRDWDVHSVVAPTNAELYVALRKPTRGSTSNPLTP